MTDRAPQEAHSTGGCRFCGAALEHTVVDLGMSPLCESYRSSEQLNSMEPFYPLRLRVCHHCYLTQLEQYVTPQEIFSDYAYFSSYSDSWLRQCERYVDEIVPALELNGRSRVVEVASNDGYLLQYFLRRGIPVLGVEPAANVAAAALQRGVPTLVRFFGRETARELLAEGGGADLLIGNNVLAQVPQLNDFVAGLRILLQPEGVITIEFPHLLRTIAGNQFDQIYHEHFSYFSLRSADRVLAAHGLQIFDVEELPSHGGSLRIFACHAGRRRVTERFSRLCALEGHTGIDTLAYYQGFAARVQQTKFRLLAELIRAKAKGQRIVGYGAPGKGNTLLNYCGIGTDYLDFTVDRNPYKHGKFLPGTHIPIYSPERIREAQPDLVMILPWNLKEEIISQLSYVREWGGRFLVPIPEPAVLL